MAIALYSIKILIFYSSSSFTFLYTSAFLFNYVTLPLPSIPHPAGSPSPSSGTKKPDQKSFYSSLFPSAASLPLSHYITSPPTLPTSAALDCSCSSSSLLSPHPPSAWWGTPGTSRTEREDGWCADEPPNSYSTSLSSRALRGKLILLSEWIVTVCA